MLGNKDKTGDLDMAMLQCTVAVEEAPEMPFQISGAEVIVQITSTGVLKGLAATSLQERCTDESIPAFLL